MDRASRLPSKRGPIRKNNCYRQCDIASNEGRQVFFAGSVACGPRSQEEDGYSTSPRACRDAGTKVGGARGRLGNKKKRTEQCIKLQICTERSAASALDGPQTWGTHQQPHTPKDQCGGVSAWQRRHSAKGSESKHATPSGGKLAP
jgi:hypothetical protein